MTLSSNLNEGGCMTEKCSKESEIGSLFKTQGENQKSLIRIETLLDSLIKYQISEQKEATVAINGKITSLETQVTDLKNLTFKIIASAASGGVVGSFIFNFIKDRL
jgi:polyhydroxyalkanoate synthesis regulator phasin